MNWDAVGAIGQILGAFAVVVTLGYLAVQVRVARSTAADANRLTRAVGVREAMLSVISSDVVIETLVAAYGAESYYQALGREFSLSVNAAARADCFNVHWFWLHWGHFSSSNDPEDLIELSHHIRTFYVTPVVRYSWENSPFARAMLDRKFVAYVEGLLRGTSAT